MQERSVIERLQILERKVELLEALPARVTAVELQLVQLRGEMHVEFSAIRAEMTARVDALRDQLRDEVRSGDAETRRYMRVLHEEVIARIATIPEAGRPRKKR